MVSLSSPRKRITGSQKENKMTQSCAKKSGNSLLRMRFTPVITPDVLWETDVEGGVTVFTMFRFWLGITDELADVFGKLVRTICEFSFWVSLTIIVVSTCRDCPRDRCWGNETFLSFDATLNIFLIPFRLISCLFHNFRNSEKLDKFQHVWFSSLKFLSFFMLYKC